jgi:tyrosine-protein phosphatase SIW14
MRVFRRLSHVSAAAAILVSLTLLSVAQAKTAKSTKCSIKNFGSVNETLYRGAQPNENDIKDLSAMGVKTVIDLQQGGMGKEQSLVEAQGMKFYRIGMSDHGQPTSEQVELFLKIVNDPASQPVFIHCAGGRHRTGAMSAIYRMTHDGWSADQAFDEMKQYDFNYGMGHGPLKQYVYDYYSRIDQKNVVVKTGGNF